MSISTSSIGSPLGNNASNGINFTQQLSDSHTTGASPAVHTFPSPESPSSSHSDSMSSNDSSASSSAVDNQRTLFLGDLPKFCNEDQLIELLSPFGAVESVYMKKNKRDGTSLGYGFVTLSTRAEASSAMDKLNGTMFGGRNLKVKWGMKREEMTNSSSNLQSPSVSSEDDAFHVTAAKPSAREKAEVINSLYVCFNAETPQVHVNEETLHKAFSKFGHIEDVTIKASEIDKVTLFPSLSLTFFSFSLFVGKRLPIWLWICSIF